MEHRKVVKGCENNYFHYKEFILCRCYLGTSGILHFK